MSVRDVKVISVPVSDQERAKAFYVNKLGFELTRDDDSAPGIRWIQVTPKAGHDVADVGDLVRDHATRIPPRARTRLERPPTRLRSAHRRRRRVRAPATGAAVGRRGSDPRPRRQPDRPATGVTSANDASPSLSRIAGGTAPTPRRLLPGARRSRRSEDPALPAPVLVRQATPTSPARSGLVDIGCGEAEPHGPGRIGAGDRGCAGEQVVRRADVGAEAEAMQSSLRVRR